MDNEYKHDNLAIIRETGLPYQFLKRCNAELPILDGYREKKDKNKIYYNDNGLILWREIRKLFEQGKTMIQISNHLESIFETTETNQRSRPETTGNEVATRKPEGRGEAVPDSHTALWIEALEKQALSAREGWQKAAEAIEREADTIREENHNLKQRLLALPDGRTPEQLAQELDKKAEQERQLVLLEEENKANANRAKELARLLAHYESLKGWGKRKERAGVWEQIKAIQL